MTSAGAPTGQLVVRMMSGPSWTRKIWRRTTVI